MICIDDFEESAKRNLPYAEYSYFSAGTDDDETLRDSREAFKRYRLRPRILRDVSTCDLRTTLLGHPVSMPIGISPTSLQGFAHYDREVATARAAAKADVVMGLSIHCNATIEEVASAASPSGNLWMQVQFMKNPRITERVVQRSEAAGFKALVLTVDMPVLGKRKVYSVKKEARNVMSNLDLPNDEEVAEWKAKGDCMLLRYGAAQFISPTWEHVRDLRKKTNLPMIAKGVTTDLPGDAEVARYKAEGDSMLIGYGMSQFMSPTWGHVRELRKNTKLPFIAKGVTTAAGALEAVANGCSAVFVSAHGGRQLDCIRAPIDALSEVVKAVKHKGIQVYLDGGIRNGTDVFKALALGADAVFLGRPVLWGLAHDGANGVSQVLDVIRDEFKRTMALMGCTSLRDIQPSMVVHESKYLNAKL